jgi:hypothetical protein
VGTEGCHVQKPAATPRTRRCGAPDGPAIMVTDMCSVPCGEVCLQERRGAVGDRGGPSRVGWRSSEEGSERRPEDAHAEDAHA